MTSRIIEEAMEKIPTPVDPKDAFRMKAEDMAILYPLEEELDWARVISTPTFARKRFFENHPPKADQQELIMRNDVDTICRLLRLVYLLTSNEPFLRMLGRK